MTKPVPQQETSIRVSVVIPVYNPGRHIEALINSLAAQTLPQDDFEVIFSDDGSTDHTPARLDRLAAERDNVIVLHEPNSGWPGRPRNLGMDVARGTYVFFVDQDDWLGVEALQRMCDFADANDSDVILGRYAGHNRGVARAVFGQTKPSATLENTPLMDSLTPHKMFRLAFLREQGIRFPEGRRRLEDHVFVVQAYFLAQRISVLADYLVYYHVRRDDEENAAFQPIDPAGYYANVREVVDIVLTHTQPGKVRDRFLRRTLGTEVLSRLDGRSFLRQDAAFQRSIFDEARRLVEATMPLSVDAGLTPPQRVRAALLRADRFDDLLDCVVRFQKVRPSAWLLEQTWSDTGGFVVDVASVVLDGRTGKPWCYDADGELVYLHSPRGLSAPWPRGAAECSKQLSRASTLIVLRHVEDSEEWPAATESTVSLYREAEQVWASLQVNAGVDVRTVAGGSPLKAGTWNVYARISQTGWTKDIPVRRRGGATAAGNLRSALVAGRVVLPYWNVRGTLSIDVAASPDGIIHGRQRTPASVTTAAGPPGGGQLTVQLPLILLPERQLDASLHLSRAAACRTNREHMGLETTSMRHSSGELSMTAHLPHLSAGLWKVRFALDDPGRARPSSTGLALTASPRGKIKVVRMNVPIATQWAEQIRSVRGPIRRRLRLTLVRLRRIVQRSTAR